MFLTFSKASAKPYCLRCTAVGRRAAKQSISAHTTVAAEFAKLIDIDEWQINPYFGKIGGLDFQEREGEDALAEAVERVLAKIQAKYDKLGIADQPS